MPRPKRTIPDSLGRAMPLTRRGFGSVRHLPSGNWQASYIGPDDERHLAPDTFLHRPDAEAWLAKQYEAIKGATWKPTVDAETFGSYASDWITTRRRPDGTPLRETTLIQYRRSLDALAAIDHIKLDELTAPDIRKLHSRLTRESGATATGHHMRVLRAVLNTAYRDEVIARNPVRFELCRTSTGIEHRPPTDEELAEVLQTIEPRFKLAVCLAAFGGLRLGEWRALRRCDLAKTDGRYVVDVSQQAQLVDGSWRLAETKSASGTRKVALPEWLTPEVDGHLKRFTAKGRDALLFHAGGSGQYVDTAWNKAWTKARDLAGIRHQVRGHDLRHYYATTLAQAGASAPLLQHALGHSSIAMSMKYVHAAKGASPELADLIKPIH